MSNLDTREVAFPPHMVPNITAFVEQAELMLCKSGALFYSHKLLSDTLSFLLKKSTPKLQGFFYLDAACFEKEVKPENAGGFSLIYTYFNGPWFACSVAYGDLVSQRLVLDLRKNEKATDTAALRPEEEALLKEKVFPFLRRFFSDQKWEVSMR